jgi:hypothetical protein
MSIVMSKKANPAVKTVEMVSQTLENIGLVTEMAPAPPAITARWLKPLYSPS